LGGLMQSPSSGSPPTPWACPAAPDAAPTPPLGVPPIATGGPPPTPGTPGVPATPGCGSTGMTGLPPAPSVGIAGAPAIPGATGEGTGDTSVEELALAGLGATAALPDGGVMGPAPLDDGTAADGAPEDGAPEGEVAGALEDMVAGWSSEEPQARSTGSKAQLNDARGMGSLIAATGVALKHAEAGQPAPFWPAAPIWHDRRCHSRRVRSVADRVARVGCPLHGARRVPTCSHVGREQSGVTLAFFCSAVQP
jgi:hypothetical protein